MSVRSDLADVITRELRDCQRAVEQGDAKLALRELNDAVKKLKEIEGRVARLERKPA